MNKIKNIFILTAAALCFVSCGDKFLEEVDTLRLTTDDLNTPEIFKQYAAGVRTSLRMQAAQESCIAHFQIGTDEFSTGGDASQQCWNNYDDRLTAYISTRSGLNDVDPGVFWDDTYTYLNNINIVIDKAPTVLEDDPEQNAVLGSAYFLRAWNHFNLVQQWGDVPVMDKAIYSFTREFASRTPKQEALQFVIDDFEEAYKLLDNPASRGTGKIYKDAAAHFLAKALLYRQSEINDGFNAATKADDLTRALFLCDEIINSGRHPLATNYADLHNFDLPNDPKVEGHSEIILSASHGEGANRTAAGTPSNYLAMYYISLYQNWTGMVRDLGGGREYQRMRTTDYSMDVFDRVNDSRFWKSFRTMQLVNQFDRNPNTTQDGRVGTIVNGQVGVMHIINNANDYARFQSTVQDNGIYYFPGGTAGRKPLLIKMDDGTGTFDYVRSPAGFPGEGNIVPNVIPRYRTIENDAYLAGAENAPEGKYYGYKTAAAVREYPGAECTFPSLSKFMDGTRPAIGADGYGTRDFVAARVGETYLIAAEVKVRQNDYEGALPYINKLRERAAYKTGEDRSIYWDGAQAYHAPAGAVSPNISSYCPVNTYYISNNIPDGTTGDTYTNLQITSISSLPAQDEAIIAKLGITDNFNRMLCLILNERTRELCGEMMRWHDLARTKTLIARTMAYNQDAIYEKAQTSNGGLRDHHYLRPIPGRYLDAIWRDGKPLTSEEKKVMQNPGY